MNTTIKIIILLTVIFTVSAFAFATWCAVNAFNIGDISAVVVHTLCAAIDLTCFIRVVTLLKKHEYGDD